MTDPHEASERAAKLAEDIIAAVREGRPREWIESVLLSSLQEATMRERERCAALAAERAEMWQHTRINDPSWPAGGRTHAQERYKEARAIADAVHAGVPLPPVA